jgi:hypothetical protein
LVGSNIMRVQFRVRHETDPHHETPRIVPAEAFPDAVPVAEFVRERASGNVVNREIVQRFEEWRSLRPLSPRRERDASNTSKTIAQSSSVIRVNMVGSPIADCP